MKEKELLSKTGSAILYEGGLKEEKVVAAMCHYGETYNAIKTNKEDDKYYKQLN